ncbi:hypothetical protein D623_10017748 [Myotis brandtii]|uniref:Uncharacterized protein n=1 Tax=Myotis brandtii TaxID=109478 RepID=S7Q8W8_MYOBR|nr:hypothetical protein D623_10017748 [Myotis brandtii]
MELQTDKCYEQKCKAFLRMNEEFDGELSRKQGLVVSKHCFLSPCRGSLKQLKGGEYSTGKWSVCLGWAVASASSLNPQPE